MDDGKSAHKLMGQGIGYTYDDMNHHRINTADIIRRETLLFEKYKRRLASL